MKTETLTWRARLEASASSFLPGTLVERTIVLALLLLAAVLRFWDLSHSSLTHDELSALVRVDYSSLREAISKGIVGIDTHPPGTHAFLWCWTKVFGFGTFAVKLPFVLFSLLSLFLLYRVAHAWTSAGTALLVLALFGTLQFGVMYGQIARPYAMGAFTIALAADQLTRFIARGKLMTLIAFGLALVLCAYTHHFALMEAAFIWCTGLFFITKAQRKAYLIAAAVCIAAYLPNIPLFMTQLSMKGLDEWLAVPGPDWIPQFIWWLAHFSALSAGALAVVLVFSAYLRVRHGGGSTPVWVIALVWGLLPLVIGYAYSLWRAPVLQYSMLLYSMPFLFMGLFAGLRHAKPVIAAGIAVGSALICTITLITVREHYTIFYKSKYDAMVQGIREAQGTDRLALIYAPDEVIHFLLKREGVNADEMRYVQLQDKPTSFLDSVLTTAHASEVFVGQVSNATPEIPAVVQSHYPFLIARNDMADGQTFLFQAKPAERALNDQGSDHPITPEAITSEGWSIESNLPLFVDTATSSYPMPKRWDFSGREYGVAFEQPVYKLMRMENDVIEVTADVSDADPQCRMNLVVELRDGEHVSFYRSSELGRDMQAVNGKARLVATIKLADMPGHGEGLRMKAYLYNRDKHTVRVNALNVRTREGNPVLYGFFQPIKGEWKYR